jgi:hypothetical protein
MKIHDSSRRVAIKPLALSRETLKSLVVRTGVQTGLAIGIGPTGNQSKVPCLSVGFC